MENTLNADEEYQRIVYPVAPKEEYGEKDRRYRRWKRRAPIILAWAAVVLLVAFLVLLISSKVGQFDSIPDMLYFIQQHLG